MGFVYVRDAAAGNTAGTGATRNLVIALCCKSSSGFALTNALQLRFAPIVTAPAARVAVWKIRRVVDAQPCPGALALHFALAAAKAGLWSMGRDPGSRVTAEA